MQTREPIPIKMITAALVMFVLGLCLFGDNFSLWSVKGVGVVFRVASIVFHDPNTQWMVFLCLGTYFTVFLFFRFRTNPIDWRLSNPSSWLAIAMLISAVVYAFNYPSTEALTLLAGATLGSGGNIWASSRPSSLHIKRAISTCITLLVLLLSFASIWLWVATGDSQYRDQTRWSGPWYNPNIFGLLMGTGFVLAIGLVISRWHMVVGHWKMEVRRLAIVVCLFAALLMGRGLLHSYSRGAWLATFCGTAYLFWNLRRGNAHLTPAISLRPPGGEGESLSCASWCNKNWLSLSAILLSVVVLSFWHYRATEWYPARRAFSVTNTLDSTWRNRVAAWECALQIAAEHPWFGAGWNQPGRLYKSYYFLPEVPESAVIELNDYLLLGATLGIPALFCFGMYIWLSLTMKTGDRSQKSEAATLDFRLGALDSLQATCRAAVIVLLVGFWFDGGLFRLPTAATFWILLELGAATMQNNTTLATDEHRFSQIKTTT